MSPLYGARVQGFPLRAVRKIIVILSCSLCVVCLQKAQAPSTEASEINTFERAMTEYGLSTKLK